ncbi:hypothetical protein CBR_g6285 [Chara braunii]|uniref:Right handed beta helix domain-containing protein n=1 Tax=Chara braunii TaxID=69332 RepID=A0A388KJC6_CHABU|nr:hypothetical protein CBR_g6285 [Chara braunii]|eukprot:GBG70154.1 hypothetical protein CBR_g6285 [Chara braunii]
MASRGGGRCRSRHDGGAGVRAFFSSFFFFFVFLLVLLLAMAAVPSSATTEAQLRAAVLSSTARVLLVDSDILLTSSLPQVVCPDLTIRGRCGRRLCKIDGRGRFRGFFQPPKISISGIELTRMSSSTAAGQDDAAAIFGDSNSSPTVVLSNVRISYARNRRAVQVFEGTITASNTVFLGNAAGAIALSSFTRLDGRNVQFISNKARWGGAITSSEGIINCTNCRFERNEAQLGGGAVIMGDVDGTEAAFFKCSFVRNKVTNRGGEGGAVNVGNVDSVSPVRFCRNSFVSNTAKTAGGATVTSHVWISTSNEDARVNFCPSRPSTGVTITNPAFVPNVIDTCSAC